MGVTMNFLGILLFITIFGYMVSYFAGTEYILLNPFALGGIVVSFIALIVAGNTTIVRGGATAVITSLLFGSFFLDFTALGVNTILAGLIITPIAIGFFLLFAEVSRG